MANQKDTALATQSKSQIKSYNNITTIHQVLENYAILETETILSYKKSLVPKVYVAKMVEIVGGAVQFFSVGKGMDDTMLAETIRLIQEEYYWLTFVDLRIFFDKLKKGDYGKTFDRMDGNVILVALREYSEERMRIANSMSEVAHNQTKTIYETENFVLRIDGNFWIRENGLVYEEVSERVLATQFTYANAIKIQQWLKSHQEVGDKTEVKLERANKADIKLLDYLKDNKPELLTEKTKYQQATKDYYEKKKLIDANESLSDFEKENAKRKLAKLEPLTQEEYITRKNTIIYKP